MILPWSEKVTEKADAVWQENKMKREEEKKVSFPLGRNYQLQSQKILNYHKGSILKILRLMSSGFSF